MKRPNVWGDPDYHGTGGYRAGCRCDICRISAVAYLREWKKRNPEKVKEYRDPEKAREISKQWRARNPEKVRAQWKRSDERKRAAKERMK